MDEKKIKVLLAKPGLDGHDRGLKLIARFLRDSGMEVVYLGLFQTAEAIVSSAIEEDVDVIGLSTLDGGHILVAEDVRKILEEKNANIPVVFGGIIPDRDIPMLKELGVKAVFPPGSPMDEIIKYIRNLTSFEKKED